MTFHDDEQSAALRYRAALAAMVTEIEQLLGEAVAEGVITDDQAERVAELAARRLGPPGREG